MLSSSLQEGLNVLETRMQARVLAAEKAAAEAHGRLDQHDATTSLHGQQLPDLQSLPGIVHELQAKTREMERQLASQGSEVSKVQAAVRVETESKDPGYDRAPDPSILRI